MDVALIYNMLADIEYDGGSTGFTDEGMRAVLVLLNHITSYDGQTPESATEMRTRITRVLQDLIDRMYPVPPQTYTTDERKQALAAVAIAYDSRAAMLVNAGYEIV